MECYATPLGESNFYFFTDLYCARNGLNARFALPTLGGRRQKEGHLDQSGCKVLLENLQVLFKTDITLLVVKYSVSGNSLGRNTFSKIVALIV